MENKKDLSELKDRVDELEKQLAEAYRELFEDKADNG